MMYARVEVGKSTRNVAVFSECPTLLTGRRKSHYLLLKM